MDVITDSTVMLDHGSCVQNTVFPDLSTRIDHDFRHDDGPILKSGRLRYHRRRMDQCGGQQAMIESSLKACGPHFVFPNGHQILRATFVLQQLQVPTSSEDLAVAEFMSRFLASIVDEGNSFESPHRPCDIEDHLAVPAGTPQHEQPRALAFLTQAVTTSRTTTNASAASRPTAEPRSLASASMARSERD